MTMMNEEGCFFVLLGCVGLLFAVVGWVGLAVNGFRTSTPWGILMGLFPSFAAPCFALYHWRAARLPMALHYGGIGVMLGGSWLVKRMYAGI
jgi:hypothetical protein